MALAAPQIAEWRTLLRDVQPVAVRDRLVGLLSADPGGGGTAYDVAFVRGLASLDDVEATVASVPGFRVGDVKRFMQTYRTIVSSPNLDNQAVITSQVIVAMDASAARGDSAAQRATQIEKAVRKAFEEADDAEGKSNYCYALLRLRTDSSKLGKVAAEGTELEDADHVFTEKGVENTASEWKKHLGSRKEWLKLVPRARFRM